MLLQACLGISIDGNGRKLIFDRSYLPEGIPQLWIRQLRIGNTRIDVLLERQVGTVRFEVLEKQGELDVIVR